MKITNFEKNNLKIIRTDIENALKDVADKYGIDFELGSITYSDYGFSTKLKGSVSKTEESIEEKRKLFEMYCSYFDIPKDAYMKTYKGLDGKKYKLVGINPNAPKNYLIIHCEDNDQQYRCPKDFLFDI